MLFIKRKNENLKDGGEHSINRYLTSRYRCRPY